LLVGLVGCEIRLCAFVRPRVPCVSCVSRLPPVSFYRYPRCLFTGCEPDVKPKTKTHLAEHRLL
jgi:hypothetical protein